MTWKLYGLLTSAFLLVAGAPPGAVAPVTASVADTGSVEGVLSVKRTPQRRTVDRYGGQTSPRAVQPIAPVLYLKGSVGPDPAAASNATMAQRDTSFVPGLLVVPVGTTVRFPNRDPFFHNVFSYSSAARFDLGRYSRGESKDVEFTEPGIVKVYCEVHEPMRAAIVVVENSYWATPDSAGHFRIAGVPAGSYTLVAWHADRGDVEREITVPAGGVVRVELEL